MVCFVELSAWLQCKNEVGWQKAGREREKLGKFCQVREDVSTE